MGVGREKTGARGSTRGPGLAGGRQGGGTAWCYVMSAMASRVGNGQPGEGWLHCFDGRRQQAWCVLESGLTPGVPVPYRCALYP